MTRSLSTRLQLPKIPCRSGRCKGPNDPQKENLRVFAPQNVVASALLGGFGLLRPARYGSRARKKDASTPSRSVKRRSQRSKRAVSAFERFGFSVVTIKGFHVMKKPGHRYNLSVPVHKGDIIKKGTLRALIGDTA